LAALFAAYPGKGLHLRPTLKGLRARATLSGLTQLVRIPRVERHKTLLNPGLCADAPLGHLGIKNYAALSVLAGYFADTINFGATAAIISGKGAGETLEFPGAGAPGKRECGLPTRET